MDFEPGITGGTKSMKKPRRNHSAGASATRGGITIRLGAAASFADSNSLTPCGRAADVWFIFSASGRVTRLQTNSPVALILDTVSFHPDELNMTIGGWSHTALK